MGVSIFLDGDVMQRRSTLKGSLVLGASVGWPFTPLPPREQVIDAQGYSA